MESATKKPTSPFRWPVSAEQEIAAPAADVWSAISQPGNLEQCHPFCASNPVHSWPGADSRDEIHYLSGWMYERRFREWSEGVGYDLEIGRPGGGKSEVSWRITPLDDGRSTLRIEVRPDALQNMPVVIRWAPHVFKLQPLLRSYLDSVVRGFDWYVTRGERVPRNAFGKHPWFS
ncbi:MAG: SRPBCC family protein [Woeseiaceae bacterium]|nr:SRPBCC family protein [Woeseiaceae bacterium]